MATILLVEDDEIIQDMLSERLGMHGFQVLTAENGVQAIDVAHAAQPNLILMDMSLSIMDGWEATRRLKETADTRAIPIIALTAHAIAGDRERCLAVGCDEYESKPVNFPRLLDKIDAFLSHAPAL